MIGFSIMDIPKLLAGAAAPAAAAASRTVPTYGDDRSNSRSIIRVSCLSMTWQGREEKSLAIRPASGRPDVSAKEAAAAREEYHRREPARH